MKPQSVLYNYTNLPNWENETTSTKFNFLKLNAPFTTYFRKSPKMTSPLKITKKAATPQRNFWEPKSSPIDWGEEDIIPLVISTNIGLVNFLPLWNQYLTNTNQHLLINNCLLLSACFLIDFDRRSVYN